MLRAPCLLLCAAASLGLTQVVSAATYYVGQQAPSAADGNPGTKAAPLKTIQAAMKLVQPGDSVLVADGVYREEVTWPGEDWGDPARRITLTAAEGAHTVIEGADPVPGPWEPAEVALAAPPEGPVAVYACSWEPRAQMVLVDGDPLAQIGLQGNPRRAESTNGFQFQRQWDGKGVEDMRPGSFYHDLEAKRLYVWLADGSDPRDHSVEAAVREVGILARGTWTVRGLEVRHIADGFWPREQAVAVSGNQAVVEDCHIHHNDFLGLIVSGQDGIIRNNEVDHNGLCGMVSNYGHRMLVEGNEFHHNAWRGDVNCLSSGNKWVQWREARFLRNHFHDEPAAALWCDINVQNALIAENLFENCSVGVYFEISRWGVIANNIVRNCGRGIWVYSSDVLVAHNIIDGCGEGITVTGHPREATYVQSVKETPARNCLMAVRNVLVVDNILIDCPGSFVGITKSTPFGWGNWSDYNAFVWTLPVYHRTGQHINFMDSWDTLYSRLPIWRMERHCDTHSVLVDPGVWEQVRGGSPYVSLGKGDVLREVRFADRAGGDYRLEADSPLGGRGVTLPPELNSPYRPGPGDQVLSRAWATTFVADAPDPAQAASVYGGENGHYRLQPLPRLHPLVDLDACEPGTPGLNAEWAVSGSYPRFVEGDAEVAEPDEWAVLPENLLADPSFDKPFAKPGDDPAPGPWIAVRGVHQYTGMACANLLPGEARNAYAYQMIGTVRPNAEYILYGEMTVSSRDDRVGAVGGMYLAVGEALSPLGGRTVGVHADPGKTRGWASHDLRVTTGREGADPAAGEDLYVVITARVDGAPTPGDDPVAFVRWDDIWLLASPARE